MTFSSGVLRTKPSRAPVLHIKENITDRHDDHKVGGSLSFCNFLVEADGRRWCLRLLGGCRACSASLPVWNRV